jgi:hypothetical protein
MQGSAELIAFHQKRLAAAIREAAAKAEQDYRDRHPEAGAISVRSDLFVYPKRPRGFSNHPAKVVGWYLQSRHLLRETNRETIARLEGSYDEPYKIPANLFTRELSQKQLDDVADVLAQHGQKLDLKVNNTLSKIKKALRAIATSAGGSNVYALELFFGGDKIVVGGVEYGVTKRGKHSAIRVGRSWLRYDVLEALAKRTNKILTK